MSKRSTKDKPVKETREWISPNYCTQCHDVVSGKTGDFFYDEEHRKATGEFKATSEVFDDLYEFFKWANVNGKETRHGGFK